jgi:methyl-accepting chemotaxis protein
MFAKKKEDLMNRFGVRGKLMWSVGVLAFGYLLFLGLVQWTASVTQEHLTFVEEAIYPAAIDISHAQAGFKKLNKDYEAAVLMQDKEGLRLGEADRDDIQFQLARARKETAGDPALQHQIESFIATFSAAETRSASTYGTLAGAGSANPDDTARLMQSLATETHQIERQFEDLNIAVGQVAFKAQLQAVTESNSRQRMMAFFLFLVALAIAVVTLFLMEKQVSRPLRVVSGQLALGADQVSASAGQVASSGISIAKGASLQAASLEETSASSEEIRSMAQQCASDCRTTANLVDGAQAKFANADRALQDLITAMDHARASSAKVSKIIKAIDEIAFKTNILALNAAVEAARAGQAGMGFAVVAEEVRHLAQQCAVAARDSAEIVEESLRTSNDGQSKVEDVAASIHAVTEDSLKIKILVDQISGASAQQTGGIAQITVAMSQMERVTQAAAATRRRVQRRPKSSPRNRTCCRRSLRASAGLSAAAVRPAHAGRPGWLKARLPVYIS